MLWRRMVINDIRSDPDWNSGNYTKPPSGWLRGYEVLRMLIDSVPHLQAIVLDGQAADRFVENARKQAEAVDANDILYSLKSSADYDPEPGLASIKTKVFALNFADDAFNPEELHVLERLMPRVAHGRFFVQPGSETSFGHLTMAHPELWAQHVGEFMRWLGSAASEPMTRLDMIQLTITRIVLTSGPRVGRRVELLARMYAPVQVAAPRRYRLKGFEAGSTSSCSRATRMQRRKPLCWRSW